MAETEETPRTLLIIKEDLNPIYHFELNAVKGEQVELVDEDIPIRLRIAMNEAGYNLVDWLYCVTESNEKKMVRRSCVEVKDEKHVEEQKNGHVNNDENHNLVENPEAATAEKVEPEAQPPVNPLVAPLNTQLNEEELTFSDRLFQLMMGRIRKYTYKQLKIVNNNIGFGMQGEVQLILTPDSPIPKVLKKFQDLSYLKEMMNEFVTLMEFGYHEHIVQLLGMTYADTAMEKPIGIVMEHMNCGALSDVIHMRNEDTFLHSYDESKCLEWCLQIAGALKHLHSNNLIHRDLKPGNILVSDVGGLKVLKIADFGFAKKSVPMVPNSKCGSPSYAAPELRRNNIITEAVDIYSFAITIWEIVERCVPGQKKLIWIDGPRGMRIQRPPMDKVKYEWMKELLPRMWHEDSAERFGITQVYENLYSFYSFVNIA